MSFQNKLTIQKKNRWIYELIIYNLVHKTYLIGLVRFEKKSTNVNYVILNFYTLAENYDLMDFCFVKLSV